jgi:hypothetical protein
VTSARPLSQVDKDLWLDAQISVFWLGAGENNWEKINPSMPVVEMNILGVEHEIRILTPSHHYVGLLT